MKEKRKGEKDEERKQKKEKLKNRTHKKNYKEIASDLLPLGSYIYDSDEI